MMVQGPLQRKPQHDCLNCICLGPVSFPYNYQGKQKVNNYFHQNEAYLSCTIQHTKCLLGFQPNQIFLKIQAFKSFHSFHHQGRGYTNVKEKPANKRIKCQAHYHYLQVKQLCAGGIHLMCRVPRPTEMNAAIRIDSLFI